MSAMAASTLAMVSSLTGAERLITADTVEIATPARLATSLMVDTAPPCEPVSDVHYTKRFVFAISPVRWPQEAHRAVRWSRNTGRGGRRGRGGGRRGGAGARGEDVD